MTELNLICVPADLHELYEGARDDHEPYAPCVVSRLIERVARAEDGQQLATLKQDNDALRSSDLAFREQIKALNETIASQAAAIRSMSKPIDRQHKSEHWLNPGTGNIECKCCEQWMADYQVAIEEREEARDTIKKLAESLLYARRNQKGTNGS